MAESIVSLDVETLGSLIRDEVVLQKNFHKELEHIKVEFRRIQVFLKDAYTKEEIEGGKLVEVRLQQLRHVAFDIEDLLAEYVFQYHEQHLHVHGYGTCGFLYKVKNFLHKYLFQRPKLAHQIKDIKGRLEKISEGRENFQLWSSTFRPIRRDPRYDALFLDDDKVVGIDENKSKLITRLITGETSLGVSCVFGQGGVGKTTLVKKVYDNQQIKSHFSIRGWISVSQNYGPNRLLMELIWPTLNEEVQESVGSQLVGVDVQDLKQMLHNSYQGRRYLIVVDDIWDIAAWNEIKSAFVDSGCGSRIIVTTRSERIANYCQKNSEVAFKLEPLSPDDSLSLFQKMASKSDVLKSNCSSDQHIEGVILNFLRRCDGLPLAIVAIARLLSTKHTIVEWERIYVDNGSLLSLPVFGDVNFIFSLSYNDLPYLLKSCLLYLCMFPEDHLIDCSSLLRLWIAEGFCDSYADDITKEDKAEGYLDELIARSLVQVQKNDYLSGRPSKCRIHGLLRDFILKKARDQEFAECLRGGETNNGRLRRVSFLDAKEIAHNTLSSSLRQFRSLLIFGQGTTCSTLSRMICGGGIKLLKVLYLEDAILAEFPGEILTNLYFLRYLGINAEKFSHPSSLGRLVNLETLVLKGHLLFQLPNEILQLKCLRNLFGDLLKLPKGIGGMTTLEKLNLVVGYDGIDKELGKLTRLRSLCIVSINKKDTNFVLSSLETMEHLRCLNLRLPKDNVLDVHNLNRFPPPLQSLTLVGAMNDVPRQIFSLENLAELKLSYSGVRGSALFEGLQLLPKLVELVLEMDAIDDAKLHFRMGSFSKLVTLELHGLRKLESIEVVEGAMPCIQNIRFISCPLLEHVPVGIEHLTTLKRIGLAKMASNLEGELRSHLWKAGHSPTVMSFADEFEMDSSTIRSFVDELDTAY